MCHDQCKRQSKTVYLITKWAKVYFKNEQCGLDEFEVRCLKTVQTERESANYITALYMKHADIFYVICHLRFLMCLDLL